MFHEQQPQRAEDTRSDGGASEDSDGCPRPAPHVRYAYDAVKERYEEMMRSGKAAERQAAAAVAAAAVAPVKVNGVR